MFDELCNYMMKKAKRWNASTNRADKDYKIKTRCFEDNNSINLYKVGCIFKGEVSWSFFIGAAMENHQYLLHFFLDTDAEEKLIESIEHSGYVFTPDKTHWMKSLKITFDSFDAFKDFLEEHVWKLDPGYLY